jgi:hypothetical protein
MQMLKRLLLCLALLTGLAAAQVDIPITQIGPYKILARNATWAGSGVGALNNNYIFTPTYANEGVCVYASNNDAGSTHSFSIQLFGNGDPANRTLLNNQNSWVPLGPSSTTVVLPILQTAGAVNSTQSYFFQANGATNIAVAIAGGSGTSTGTFTMVESPTTTPVGCGNTVTGPVFCPLTLQPPQTIASGITDEILTPIATKGVYLCTLTLSFATAPAAGSVTISVGPGAACSPGGAVLFNMQTGPTTPLVNTFSGQPLLGRFGNAGADFLGNALCITNNNATTVVVDATVAQF